MPSPRANETRSDFVTRCIPVVLDDGTAEDSGQAVAVCNVIYDREKELSSHIKRKRVKPKKRGSMKLSDYQSVGFFFDRSPFVKADGDQRFKKDLIRVGVWTHPVHDWTLDITPERLEGLSRNFSAMAEKGIDVPVVVDHLDSAESQVGLLKVVTVDDTDGNGIPNELFGEIEFSSDRGVELAKTVKNVSILIDKDFVDGEGKHFGEAITHVAIVQHPVVHDQGEFEAVAMSMKGGTIPDRNGKEVPEFTLSKSSKEETKMLDEIKKIFGIEKDDKDFDEEKALSLIKKAFERPEEDNLDALEKANTRIQSLETEVKALSAKDDSLKVDEDVLDEIAESAETKMEALVDGGHITPKCAASLTPILIGSAGKRNGFFLSRKMSGTDISLTKNILNALKDNCAVELGVKTKFAMSRNVPDADENKPDPADTKSRGANVKAQMGVTEAS